LREFKDKYFGRCINNRIRWYGCVLVMNEDRPPPQKKTFNMKVKGKYLKKSPKSRWEQQVTKDAAQKERRTGEGIKEKRL
jgi:hypothetical protein